MNTIYYVIDKHYASNGVVEEAIGTKEVTAYTIENNKLEMFVQYHELDNEDSSEEQIKNYLDEINMDSTKVKLVQL